MGRSRSKVKKEGKEKSKKVQQPTTTASPPATTQQPSSIPKAQKGPFSEQIDFYTKTKDFVDWSYSSKFLISLPPVDYPQHLPRTNQFNSNLITKWTNGLNDNRVAYSEKLTQLLLTAKNNSKPVCIGFLTGQCNNNDRFQCCYNHDIDCYNAFAMFCTSHMKYQFNLNSLHIICRINQSSQHIRQQFQQDLMTYCIPIRVPLVFGCDPKITKYKSSLERLQCTGELVNYFENVDDYAEYYTAAVTEEMHADRLETEKQVQDVQILWQQASYASGDPKVIATVSFTDEQRGKLTLAPRTQVAFYHPDVPITIPSKPIECTAATFASNQSTESLIIGCVKSFSYKDDAYQFVLLGSSVAKFASIIKSLPQSGWSIAVVFTDVGYRQQLDILKNISFNEKLTALFLGKQVQNNISTSSSTTTTTPLQDWRSNSTLFPAEFLPPQITSAPSLRPLNDSQRRAIELALTNPVLSVQGPPGTGKSTTLSNLVYHLNQTRQLQQRTSLEAFYTEQINNTKDIELGDLLTMMKAKADSVAVEKGKISTKIKGKYQPSGLRNTISSTPSDEVTKSIPTPPSKLTPILVAAPSNIAVDHLAELLMYIPDIDVLRISSKRHRSTTFAKDNDHVENAALHRRVEAWLNENPDSDLSKLHEQFFGDLSLDERATLNAKLDDIMNTDLPQQLSHLKDKSEQTAVQMAIFFQELDRQGVRINNGKKKLSEADKKQLERDFDRWKWAFYDLQNTIISNADVVCTTFAFCANRELFPPESKYEHVILDEVSQGSEISLLLPLSHFPQHLVLFGDQKQLGPIVKQKGIYREVLLRSMFDRLVETKSCPTTMLSIQYRMHPTIAAFSSKQFYNGNVTSGVTKQQRSKFQDSFPWPQIDHPICFISTTGVSQEQFEGHSCYNLSDIRIIVQLLKLLIQQGIDLSDIGVVLPYSAQARYLRKELFSKDNGFVQDVYNQYLQPKQSFKSNYTNSNNNQKQSFNILSKNGHVYSKKQYDKNDYEFDDLKLQDVINLIEETLQIDTVDAFQGREKPLMIFNSVRSARKNGGGKYGSFITDNRLNVAITRAQHGFIIVGDDNFFDDNGTLSQFKHFYQYNQRLIQPYQHQKLFDDFNRIVEIQIMKKQQHMNEQRQKRIQAAEARKQQSIENRPIILSSNATPFYPTLPPPE